MGEPLHAAERKRLAEAAGVPENVVKLALQRLIGGGRGPGKAFLQKHGGIFADSFIQLDVELEEVCKRNFEEATPRQRAALADKPRPDRSFWHTSSWSWSDRRSSRWNSVRTIMVLCSVACLGTRQSIRQARWMLSGRRSET